MPREPEINARELMKEFRLFFDGGDPWGSTMVWWFAVAGEMYARGLPIPDEWQYRPGISPKEPEQIETEICEQASDNALRLFGRAMDRYACILKRGGRDY